MRSPLFKLLIGYLEVTLVDVFLQVYFKHTAGSLLKYLKKSPRPFVEKCGAERAKQIVNTRKKEYSKD